MKLADMRQKKLFSVRGLAKAAGVSSSMIYSIEHEKRMPGLKSIGKISRALNLDPLEIDEFADSLDKAGMGKAAQGKNP